jgi:hypothetical protein
MTHWFFHIRESGLFIPREAVERTALHWLRREFGPVESPRIIRTIEGWRIEASVKDNGHVAGAVAQSFRERYVAQVWGLGAGSEVHVKRDAHGSN